MSASTQGRGSPMHVAAVVATYPKLSETFVLDQISRLTRAGHRVTVIGTPAGTDLAGGAPGELVARRPFPDAPRHLQRVARQRRRRVAAQLELAVRAPGATRTLLVRGPRDGFVRWRTIETFLPLLRIGPPDVIHAHFGWFGAHAAEAVAAMGWRTPVVTSFHGADLSTYVRRHGAQTYRRLFETGTLFLPVSEHWRDRLLAMGAPPERTLVHHMGVDPDRFPYRERTEVGDGSLRVLSIGRHVAKKGFDVGLRAIGLLRARGVEVTYTVVGEGPLRSELESTAKHNGLSAPTVRFTGALSPSAVRAEIDRHDVLLAPSVTGPDGDCEGIPVVLMEAMASGLPVVASRHSGIPELVIDGHCGLLAPEHDVGRVAAHLERLALDPATSRRLARSARRRVEQDFHAAVLARRFEQLLASVVGGGHAGVLDATTRDPAAT